MKKRLLLNTDDYGWDLDANAAIIDLLQSDSIHNVTLLANYCDSDVLRAISPFQDRASLGIHVCLNSGQALSGSTRSTLHDACGNFYDSKTLFQRAFFGELNYSDVLLEIKSQYYYLSDHGIDITHADSHQHIHQYPFLSGMITQALHEIGVKNIRRCRPLEVKNIRRYLIYFFYQCTKNNLNKFNSPDVLVTDFTHSGFSFSTDVQPILKKLSLSHYSTIEWMCHPAREDKAGSYLQRKKEYDFLKKCDWDILLNGTGIERSQYRYI
ncbi:ChbG/HpnK family deacetylase [Cytophaga hutchinsonii]|uniref:ChbG/HpnK family deacetylase n=1 Tax=Cytophaga hutchinsonii (strain ATCC 33406 / DSM 1761 / CIP 103989 / NBRC 15051 / NCIMB 9469 / D465) TaxID=269798 RepID=A0A6N4SXI7_CYTH3|nr:ChbG/HpnK family deacetylase [Cytophaga hutchinsonii]ABG61002.1 conserved hypothetical protein [Cytophaga hutchinsonii ATCC 33406]SFX44128.1 Predicted glycoside hydrolase or deacetylase ChbG, UPF0249 family [Cytophaga hutchinsonii ATCC 33406]